MTLTSIDNDDIRYNPAEQTFQALVTLPGPTGVWLVAASYHAPLATPDDLVRAGLMRAALNALATPGALRSRMISESPRATAPRPQKAA